MGLGNYDHDERTPVEDALTVGATTLDEAEEIRKALKHAAEVMMGTSLPEAACREAVIAQTAHARAMMRSDCTDEVRRRIQLAVADLHNLAGFSSAERVFA